MTDIKASGATTTALDLTGLEPVFEEYRSELVSYCYRMLGSAFEAEDAVQETMVRAWRGFDRFEGRAAVRSWLYRIATNVCIDMLRGRQRRARPIDLGPAVTGASEPGPTQRAEAWIEPIPGGWLGSASDDPADLIVSRETIRLAFVAALQHLPPRQRAVLILREVLNWKASEVAALLGGTVASVNSALQRARATLAASDLTDLDSAGSLGEENGELLARYVDAFQRYDMESLTALIHEDATQSMPPYSMWLQGRSDIF
ncbi:MAG: RNA polymerase subunit sigma-70, partial [Acidimicrobiia bacterium]